MDKDTIVLVQKIATDAALAAVEKVQRSNIARVAELAECVKVAPAAPQTSISQEYDILYKSTVELEECVKVLTEKLQGVLRNPIEKNVGGLCRASLDGSAPLVVALADRSTHVQNIGYQVRDLINRLQITP